jgi:hypothetical protein
MNGGRVALTVHIPFTTDLGLLYKTLNGYNPKFVVEDAAMLHLLLQIWGLLNP